MSKKRKAIFVAFIILFCIGIIIFSQSSKSNAVSSEVRKIDELNPDQGIYCIEYGPAFKAGTFQCYSVEYLNSDVAYVLGAADPSKYWRYDNTFRSDIRQNYLWGKQFNAGSWIGTYVKSEDINNLAAEAKVVQSLKKETAVSIKDIESGFVTANENGKYGPFVINYPSITMSDGSTKSVGDRIELTLNGKKFSLLPPSGTPFYISAKHINFGDENILKIEYKAYQYAGVLYKYQKLKDDGITVDDAAQDIGIPNIWKTLLEAEDTLEFWAGQEIKDLKLIKVNTSIAGEKIQGITFEAKLENATIWDSEKSTGTTECKVTTNENGEASLGNVRVINPGEDIVITLKEIGTPRTDLNFSGTEEIRLKISNNQGKWEVTTDNNLVTATYDEKNNIMTLEIGNNVTMNLSGKAWIDKQMGIKPVYAPNGVYDAGNDELLSNIKVVAKDTSGNTLETYTDVNGNYKFENLPASVNGTIKYSITFTYDGVNYIAVNPNIGNDDTIDSDVYEIGRTEFNNRFNTIEKGKAISKDGKTTTQLEYLYTDKEAKLQTMDGKNVIERFAMNASTDSAGYDKNTENIDIGLVKKELDLAVATDILSAKVTINGKEKEYSYNDISLNDNIVIGETEKPAYSLYLYNSDYSYRMKDYKFDNKTNAKYTTDKDTRR